MKRPSVRLITVAAALVAALVFVPAAVAAPAPTKLDLSGPTKAPGGITTLTAALTSGGKPLGGKAIGLYDGGTTPIATGTTDGSGRIAFEVNVGEPTTFQAGYTPAPPDAALYLSAQSKTLKVSPTSGIDLSVKAFLRAGHRSVGVPHVPVRIRGTTARYAPGTSILLEAFRGSKRFAHKRIPEHRAGSKGAFAFFFKPGGRGVYGVRATGPGGSQTVHIFVVTPRAGYGSRGTAVQALQYRLRRLGYVTPVDGYFGDTTARAVLAFRKVNDYARTRTATTQIFRKLAHGGGAFHMRYPNSGKHVEFDWSRQVLVLARGSLAEKILPASSGKPATPTVFGKYNFYSKTPGYNSHGMYYSNYFIGGYAIHGYQDVPDYAASHGCIRIPIPSAISVYGWINLGDPIYIYR